MYGISRLFLANLGFGLNRFRFFFELLFAPSVASDGLFPVFRKGQSGPFQCVSKLVQIAIFFLSTVTVLRPRTLSS